jgi:MFS family permease
MGLIASFMGGPVIDRFGRKWIMVFSLFTNGLAYLSMGQAQSYSHFAMLLAVTGSVNPLYRIGADAMMADMIPQEKRIDAYALMRLSNNLGIAIGPAIGGFIAASSYSLAFYFASAGMIAYSFLLILFARETLPKRGEAELQTSGGVAQKKERLGGYIEIVKDRPFIGFIIAFTLVTMCATLIWLLLPVYATEYYDVPMQLYGLIPATNAIMVVTLQILVTNFTKRYPALSTVAVGALIYTISVGAIALMQGFYGFLACMILMTFGELIIVPTSSTYVANHAPPDMRGRYMSLYALTWGVASGISPVFGGFLSDTFSPTAIWIGGAMIGTISVIAFLLLNKRERARNIISTSVQEIQNP